jgi:hypothetical protein
MKEHAWTVEYHDDESELHFLVFHGLAVECRFLPPVRNQPSSDTTANRGLSLWVNGNEIVISALHTEDTWRVRSRRWDTLASAKEYVSWPLTCARWRDDLLQALLATPAIWQLAPAVTPR